MNTQKTESNDLNPLGEYRYNLGFGWFGPLEQCGDGELMKAEEVIQLYAAEELRTLTAIESEQAALEEQENLRRQCLDWKEAYYQEQDFNKEVVKFNRYWRFAAVAEAVCVALLTAHITGVF